MKSIMIRMFATVQTSGVHTCYSASLTRRCRMDVLTHLSADVRQLISINEKLQSAVLRGTELSHDELDVIRACGKELLNLTTQVNGTA